MRDEIEFHEMELIYVYYIYLCFCKTYTKSFTNGFWLDKHLDPRLYPFETGQ